MGYKTSLIALDCDVKHQQGILKLWMENFGANFFHLKRSPKIFFIAPGNRGEGRWRLSVVFSSFLLLFLFNVFSSSWTNTSFDLLWLLRKFLLYAGWKMYHFVFWPKNKLSPESEFCIHSTKLHWGYRWCLLPGCNLGKRLHQEYTQGTPWNGLMMKDILEDISDLM